MEDLLMFVAAASTDRRAKALAKQLSRLWCDAQRPLNPGCRRFAFDCVFDDSLRLWVVDRLVPSFEGRTLGRSTRYFWNIDCDSSPQATERRERALARPPRLESSRVAASFRRDVLDRLFALNGEWVRRWRLTIVGDRRNSVELAIIHAPKGGLQVEGIWYPGGQFVPDSPVSNPTLAPTNATSSNGFKARPVVKPQLRSFFEKQKPLQAYLHALMGLSSTSVSLLAPDPRTFVANDGHHWVCQAIWRAGKQVIEGLDESVKRYFNSAEAKFLPDYNHAADTWNDIAHKKYLDSMRKIFDQDLASAGGKEKYSLKHAESLVARIKAGTPDAKWFESLPAEMKRDWEQIFKWRNGFYKSAALAYHAKNIGKVADVADLKRLAQITMGDKSQIPKLATSAAREYFVEHLASGPEKINSALLYGAKKIGLVAARVAGIAKNAIPVLAGGFMLFEAGDVYAAEGMNAAGKLVAHRLVDQASCGVWSATSKELDATVTTGIDDWLGGISSQIYRSTYGKVQVDDPGTQANLREIRKRMLAPWVEKGK